jgi:4-hydroxy-3-methylbut-2-en-1-yl diphosphate reductase
MIRRVILVSPRGFCAGVRRAISTVERALALYGSPVWVRRAIVHNVHVVSRLTAAGARFVDELDEVPAGSTVVFSAHGVPLTVRGQVLEKGLRVIDATCPLVAKVHDEVRRYVADGRDVVLIGQAGHDEVVGTLGQAPGHVCLVGSVADAETLRPRDPSRLACVTQTTLSRDIVAPVLGRLLELFPQMVEPRVADICFATINRQNAVRWMATQVDTVLVLGDSASSNSRRLCEVASTYKPSYFLGSIAELDPGWLGLAGTVGITAGASTPEHVVQEVVQYLRRGGATVEEYVRADEHSHFELPPELRETWTVSQERESVGMSLRYAG